MEEEILIQEQVELAPYTTFNIGGPSTYFVNVNNKSQIIKAIMWAKNKSVPILFIGGGSNILMKDMGYPGLTVHIHTSSIVVSNDLYTIDSGSSLLECIHRTGVNGYGGWEKLSGIPGSIGGAVRGNAGAFGSEIKDFVFRVTALNRTNLKERVFTKTECEFTYRNSFFKMNPEWIIMTIEFKLSSVNPLESQKVSNETIKDRESRHIQNVACAGSFFMNPIAPLKIQKMFELEKNTIAKEGRVPAGWLIEKVGMKGYQVGSAVASLDHPNYLMNRGNATYSEVEQLAREIEKRVFEMYEIKLEREAVCL